jgi:hypothetical protein
MRDPLLHRRTILRGLGAAIALPALDAMMPRGVGLRLGSEARAAALIAETAPTRVAYLFFPNGVQPTAWTPTVAADGTWIPSATLAPLAELRAKVAVFTGLRHKNAEANGDGPGDHARSAACFLTGAQPKKTAGDDIRAGRSIDQAIADDLEAQALRGKSSGKIGAKHSVGTTRLRSLELGSEPAMTAGNCDSGYSCAYSANISWKSDSLPNGKETDPRAAFERLFGRTSEPPEARAARLRSRRSILDGAVEEARRLGTIVGRDDRARLDEYLDGVRDLERRIDTDALASLDEGELPEFEGGPYDLARRVDLLGEVLALAFRTDSTRVATLMLANEGSNRPYREIGVSAGHHDVSHHGGDAEKLAHFAAINRYQVERFAAFLRALERTTENGRSLLDSTVVLYGSAITDGNRHNHDDLPILVAGGRVRGAGQLVRCEPGTPLCNLHVGIAQAAGARMERFGDSTGVIRI